MKKSIISLLLAVVMLIAVCAACTNSQPAPAPASSPAAPVSSETPASPAAPETPAEADLSEFYKGKTINFTLNEKAGGDNELVARLTQPLIANYTGATVVIQNQRGAGGVEGINWVYDRPSADGTEIGSCILLNLILNQVTELPGVTYDADGFEYLCGISREKFAFCVSEDSSLTSIEDLQAAKGLKLGGTSAQGPIALSTMSCAALLDLDAKVITGFSTGEMTLAVISGELDGVCIPVHMVTSAEGLKPLFTLSSDRLSAFPDVPALTELTQIAAEDQELFDLWDTTLLQSHVFYASPGTDADKLAFLRGLVDVLKNDQQYISDLSSLLQLEITAEDFVTGEDMQKIVGDTVSHAAEINTILSGVIAEYRG